MPKPNLPETRCAERSARAKRKKPPKPDASATLSESSANPEALSPISSESNPRRLKKQIPVGKALRVMGLDEFAIAGNYTQIVEKLTGNDPDAGSAQKLLFDVLKECSRQLETAHKFEHSSSPAAPVIVRLVHSVSRPTRVALPATPDPVDI